MSDFNSYMWSVGDWRKDEMSWMLDNREQGIYRSFFDECWVTGSIPGDIVLLARLAREPIEYFTTFWPKISHKFKPINGGQRLISVRIEQDRRRFMLKGNFDKNRAKKAANARWAKDRAEKELHATSMLIAQIEHTFEHDQIQIHTQKRGESSLLQESPNTENLIHSTKPLSDEKNPSGLLSETPETMPVENDSFGDLIGRGVPPSHSQAKSEGKYALTSPKVPLGPKSAPVDPAVGVFEAAYATGNSGAKYPFVRLDGIKIAELRTYLNIGTRDIPDGWEQTVGNYFASQDKESKTLADLCIPIRYNIFKTKQLNQYGKANGNGQYREAVPGSFRGDPTYKPRQR